MRRWWPHHHHEDDVASSRGAARHRYYPSILHEHAVIKRYFNVKRSGLKRSGSIAVAVTAAAADANNENVNNECEHIIIHREVVGDDNDNDISIREKKNCTRIRRDQASSKFCENCFSFTRTVPSLLFLFNFAWCFVAALHVRRRNSYAVVESCPACWIRMRHSIVSSTLTKQHEVDGRAAAYRTYYLPELRESYSDDAFMMETRSMSSPKSTNTSTSSHSSSSDVTTETTVPMDTPARLSLPPHLCLRPIPGKGLGVISLKSIAMGEVVGEYRGEVMSQEVKDRRYLPSLSDQQSDEDRRWIQSRRERGQTISGCYLYGISVPPKRGGDEATTIYVDAEDEYESLWTRFLNHAPLPYGNIHPKSIHESYDGKPRVWFVANRRIDAGEEICFDYGDDYWLEGDTVV